MNNLGVRSGDMFMMYNYSRCAITGSGINLSISRKNTTKQAQYNVLMSLQIDEQQKSLWESCKFTTKSR